jgi:addiction module HigA family antidote
VAPSTLNRVLRGASRVTPEMALRLSRALGRSAESWLAMQDAHDPWVARQQVDLDSVTPLEFAPA